MGNVLSYHHRSRRPRLAAVAIVSAIAVLAAACGNEKTENKAEEATPPVPVGVFDVIERPTNPGMNFVGRVQSVNDVSIMARVDGFLTQQAFIDGQTVKQGQLLFVLEKAPLQAALDAANANLEKVKADANNAKVQADRARLLYAQKTISQATLDDRQAAELQALAAVQQAKASVEQAQINLGYTEIRAPFDGRVGIANFSIGALVGPSTGALATIISQDPIYVTFPVSDAIILAYTEGDRPSLATEDVAVHLMLANNVRYPEVGTIDFTGIKVDPNTDTVPIRAIFPNPNNILLDGQFVQVFTETKTPVEALVIPQKAVLTDQSGNYVLLVGEGNKVVQQPVTQGAIIGADVVIQSGLKKGDRVITDGLQRIRPGQEVDPQPVAEAVPATPPAPTAGN